MLYLCIGVGLLFTILTRFVQVRYLKDMSTQAPDGSFIVGHLKGVEAGPQYTQQAVETVLPGFGSGFVAVSLVFFRLYYDYVAVLYCGNELSLRNERQTK